MSTRQKKFILLIKFLLLVAITSVIFFRVTFGQAIDRESTIWVLRQPPFEIIPSIDGYPYFIPWVETVAWGGSNKNIIYVGNIDSANDSAIPHGIYNSTDYGLTWRYLGAVDEKEDIHTIVVHPTTPNIVFAGFNQTYYQGGIYRSEDGGESWINVLPKLTIFDIEIDPTNPNVVYTTTIAGQTGGITGTYKSMDEGKTWKLISSSFFHDLAVHPTSPNIIFGARRFSTNPSEGIYRSDDAGKTWSQISSIQENRIIINNYNPDQMVIFGADYYGIWRTDDGGLNWHSINSNLPYTVAPITIQSAIFDSMAPNTIWIGSKYEGMYVSYDSGNHWQEASDGLPFMNMSIYGPQCTSSDISHGRLVITCSGRLFVQYLFYNIYLPIIVR